MTAKKKSVKRPGKLKKYTPAEIQQLRRLYPSSANMVIAKKMGRTLNSVKTKASELGLKKAASYLKALNSAKKKKVTKKKAVKKKKS